MRIAGLISGTSADALDLAVTDFELSGDTLTARVIHQEEVAFPEELQTEILQLLEPNPVLLADVCRLDTVLGQFIAEATRSALARLDGECSLVVSHGQTIFHWVDDNTALGTLQIGQPAWISRATGVPTLSDVRIADIAVGGHGAPLASTLDTMLLRSTEHTTAALNLGGIANLTIVSPDADPIAYDVGPANALIDVMFRRLTDAPATNDGGALARTGLINDALLAELLDDPYFGLPAPKSTGKEHFNAHYLDEHLERYPDMAPVDVLATATEFTAVTVANDCRARDVAQVYASGGGTLNNHLMERLSHHLGDTATLQTTEELGLPSGAKEAILMGLIGWLSWHGLPATVPSCTGAQSASLAGRITPGAQPLQLPPPLTYAPTSLQFTKE